MRFLRRFREPIEVSGAAPELTGVDHAALARPRAFLSRARFPAVRPRAAGRRL